jgi:hypothetical protein
MSSYLVRVFAYHGIPVLVGNVHTRAGISRDTPVPEAQAVNGMSITDKVIDLNYNGVLSEYMLDKLVEDFELEYKCKINFDLDAPGDKNTVYEFDVFEPSWPSQELAQDVVDNLTERLVDWANGYPTGR